MTREHVVDTPRGMLAGHAQRRLDRLMLTSLLASGFFWLFLLSPPWSTSFGGLGLFLIGAAYVIPASVTTAASYVRDSVTLDQELLTHGATWMVAVVMWWWPTDLDLSDLAGGLIVGLWIATPCFVVWQLLALALRCSWRALTGRRRSLGDRNQPATATSRSRDLG